MIDPLAPLTVATAGPLAGGLKTAVPQTGFFATLNHALQDVSTAQTQAQSAEAGYAAGVPGATLAKALVASDRAQVAWNATVAVRNELVAAYQSVMNMSF